MAELPELTIRVDQVEKALDREVAKREESNKYTHRMVENVQARYAEIALSFGRIEAAFTQHLHDDKKMTIGIADLDKRIRTVERLAWSAVGGLAVIAGLIAIFGTYMVRALQ